MQAFVAPTDRQWFEFLALQPNLDEANFWLPNPWGGRFRVIRPGELLLFKLKHPYNVIAGGGTFAHYTDLPISRAWEALGTKNGAASLQEMSASIARLRKVQPSFREDFTIGCILILQPFFWREEDWMPQSADWKPTIVRGRSYDLSTGSGRELWKGVTARLRRPPGTGTLAESPTGIVPGGYGDPIRARRRLGQGTFKVLVTDAYQRQCAITREKALPVLEAAHIRPFSHIPEHSVSNGLLLRSDVHRLFDLGYLTVTPEYRVLASQRMRTDFNDGDNYIKLHGSTIFVPENPAFRPDPAVLRWHNEGRYLG
ncbi:MAG TPA: HNH endonuclease signature motif containing protein [Acidobacteriaceae bacterium]|nr:HNH endonuclease signature motif containing protein [Acidobacteriaceae bacterium]